MNPGATTRLVASIVVLALQRLGADRRDAAAVDADVGHLVVARLGIDDLAAGDDLVEGVVGWRRGIGSVERRRRGRRAFALDADPVAGGRR